MSESNCLDQIAWIKLSGNQTLDQNIQIIDTYKKLFEWIQFKKIKNLILPYETIGNKIFDDTDLLLTIPIIPHIYYFFLLL